MCLAKIGKGIRVNEDVHSSPHGILFASFASSEYTSGICAVCFCFSDSMTLDEQFDHDCLYVGTLATQRDLKDTFSAKLHLFPPDLLRLMDNTLKEQGLEGHR